MSYYLNLGQWNSIFAIPTALVDQHLKLCSEAQLKVLLYILRNSDKAISAGDISKALSVSAEEVDNAVEFWCERGLLSHKEDRLEPSGTADAVPPVTAPVPEEKEVKPQKTNPSRAQRPDSFFVSRLLKEDKNLAGLIEEAQTALSKPLSSGDTATLVMLYDTFGLPCEVIAMLINYSVSVGQANMRAIEKTAIRWSDSGIYTVGDAEREIERMASSDEAWKHVSSLYGIRNIGRPTKSQLEHAVRWTIDWSFSDEMLLEAYERCVDKKSEFNLRYINGILSKWNENNIKSLDTLKAFEEKAPKNRKADKKPSFSHFTNSSFDVSLLDEQTLFDD